eukprot:TRINITY_DN10506_c0_g1_i1.p1 TRINITY_DN10506_c0_g1~~TRINITY_DN10506_c0_g1_i1.p1  ORF type:complete len:71 (+),score=3.42 TRINITY_DN10506_c0_g1_i1:122-334(+)
MSRNIEKLQFQENQNNFNSRQLLCYIFKGLVLTFVPTERVKCQVEGQILVWFSKIIELKKEKVPTAWPLV